MYESGPRVPVRVEVALTILGMVGNQGDVMGPFADMIRSLKTDTGDAPTAKETPRKLTADEEKVRKAALDVLHLYLSGADSYEDKIQVPQAGLAAPIGRYGPAIITPEGQRFQLTVTQWETVQAAIRNAGEIIDAVGIQPEPAGSDA